MGSRLNSEKLEIHSLPALAHCFPRNFTFYVAYPIRSIRETGYLTFVADCAPAVIAIAVYRKEDADLGIKRCLVVRHELRPVSNEGTLRVLAMLTVSQLSKSFAGRALFDDVALQINRGDQIDWSENARVSFAGVRLQSAACARISHVANGFSHRGPIA